MTRPSRVPPLVAIVIVLVVAGASARLLFGGTWDDVRYHAEIAPPRLAAADAIQAGTLPAWWDGSGLGVPLASEPSHGAMYPPTWIASSPHALDWLAIAHLVWAALGVAIWARRRSASPPRHRVWLGEASEPAAVVVAILVATSGILASAAVRGALPAIAHLPWIGFAASWLAEAESKRDRARAAVALGALIGLVGLTGVFAALVDALVIAIVIAGRRGAAITGAAKDTSRDDGATGSPRGRRDLTPLGYLAAALFGGLAIAAAQWLPAFLHLLSPHTGAEVVGIPFSRLVELVVPTASGSPDPDRAIVALAGEHAWAPSVFVGAPLLALAAVRTPSRRVLGIVGVFVVLALVAGRGGWPAWLGAPEIHLAALVVVLGAHAAAGIDALLAGERRAFLSVAAGTACTVIALGSLAVLRSRHPEAAPAIERGLVNGVLGAACAVAALALVWRGPKRSLPIVFALLVLPSIGSQPSIAPVVDRSIVDTQPAWAELAQKVTPPRRVFRPVHMIDVVAPRASVLIPGKPADEPSQREPLDDAIATFVGASAWRWGIAGARSADPARSIAHDRAWHAAAMSGGLLLDRFGIALAILPETLVVPRGFTGLGKRGRWAFVELPVAPPASVMRGWSRAIDPADALALLFPLDGSRALPRGSVVLAAAGSSQAERGPPLPCIVDAWSAGDIALRCTSEVDGFAVVSSSAAPGWSVSVDDHDREWVTADVLRRAVAMPSGSHRVHWSYAAPGLSIGFAIAGIGLALLVALGLASRR